MFLNPPSEQVVPQGYGLTHCPVDLGTGKSHQNKKTAVLHCPETWLKGGEATAAEGAN